MDAFFLQALVAELQVLLTGARVNKIHQPSGELFILRLWTGRDEQRLLLDLNPLHNRLLLTPDNYPNPFTPPRFCQLLRSRLKRLVAIEQVPGERAVKFLFSGGENRRYVLLAEFFGATANLLLLDEAGTIIDVLKRGSAQASRSMMPGHTYAAPASDKPFRLVEASTPIPPQAREAEDFHRWLRSEVAPMTPFLARDFAAAVGQGGSPEEVLESFRDRWLSGSFSPGIAWVEGEQVLSAFAPRYIAVERWQQYESASEAAHAFDLLQPKRDEGIGDGKIIRRWIDKGLKKLDRRLRNIERENLDIEACERQKILGELMLANLHRLRKGMTEVVLEDYYRDPPEPVTIDLDPRISPQENAERYFKKYKKARRGREHVKRRLEETLQERSWLEQIVLALEEGPSSDDLREIAEDLQQAGFAPRQKKRHDPRRPSGLKERLRSAKSPAGFRLYWGRNPRTNDYVSRELAAADDLWFHAHNLPGCHLVLKREGRPDVPEADLLYAASLAAGYSRGQNDSYVEVMVAEGRHVHKPKGARPGLVTVERFHTMRVLPLRLDREA